VDCFELADGLIRTLRGRYAAICRVGFFSGRRALIWVWVNRLPAPKKDGEDQAIGRSKSSTKIHAMIDALGKGSQQIAKLF
jgi:hypothetical protein